MNDNFQNESQIDCLNSHDPDDCERGLPDDEDLNEFDAPHCVDCDGLINVDTFQCEDCGEPMDLGPNDYQNQCKRARKRAFFLRFP